MQSVGILLSANAVIQQGIWLRHIWIEGIVMPMLVAFGRNLCSKLLFRRGRNVQSRIHAQGCLGSARSIAAVRQVVRLPSILLAMTLGNMVFLHVVLRIVVVVCILVLMMFMVLVAMMLTTGSSLLEGIEIGHVHTVGSRGVGCLYGILDEVGS